MLLYMVWDVNDGIRSERSRLYIYKEVFGKGPMVLRNQGMGMRGDVEATLRNLTLESRSSSQPGPKYSINNIIVLLHIRYES